MSVITCKLAVRQQSSYWLQPGVIDWVSILINIWKYLHPPLHGDHRHYIILIILREHIF